MTLSVDRVWEFNKCKPPSDVQRHLYNDGNASIYSTIMDNDSSHNVRPSPFRLDHAVVLTLHACMQMVEDQSDLLKYLTQHSANLQRQIKVLQRRLEESYAHSGSVQ
jgi:hypothetical protein